jgi:hypothetical protein
MVGSTVAEAGSLFLLAQDRAQSAADKLVEHNKGTRIGVLEVTEPASERRIKIGDDTRKAIPARTLRLLPDRLLEAGEALLANKAIASFEPVAEEFESFPGLPAVADMRLLGMHTQAVFCDPSADFRQGRIGFLAALAQDHEVIRITHHPIPTRRHLFIQRMQVDVGQERADHRALRCSRQRRPSPRVLQDVLGEPAAQQIEDAAIADPFLDALHQLLVRNRVEVALQVGVHHEGIPLPDQSCHFPQGILAAAFRPEAVACRTEHGFENWLQHEFRRRLDDAILDRRHAPRQTALLLKHPLGSAEVVHPFHPLRGQRFTVLKTRRVSGVETLSLRHPELGSFAMPREWTDWAPPGAETPVGTEPLLIDAHGLIALAALVASFTPRKK